MFKRRIPEYALPLGRVGYVPLTKGRFAIVDAWMIDVVQRRLWAVANGYPRTQYGGYLHRFVMEKSGHEIPNGMVVDHINHDKFDNRIGNLRIVSPSDNNRNCRLQKHRRFRGVYWDAPRKKWAARVKRDGVFKLLGRFDSEVDAAKAYNECVKKFGGVFIFNNV